MEKLGAWAFIVGVALSIIAGLIPSLEGQSWVGWTLVVLGLLVGLLNVTARETQEFLIATIALMATGAVSGVFGGVVAMVIQNVVVFVSPAALVVALKAIYSLASEE